MKRNIAAMLALCAPLMIGCVQPKVKKDKDPARFLFENKCSRCHTIRRPESKKMTRKEWEATVMRMIKRNGAPIKEAEAKIIIDYLAKNYGK